MRKKFEIGDFRGKSRLFIILCSFSTLNPESIVLFFQTIIARKSLCLVNPRKQVKEKRWHLASILYSILSLGIGFRNHGIDWLGKVKNKVLSFTFHSSAGA